MALKLRKDVKKSLYYVWFLGAKESKGLRGSEYIIPVIKHLEQREKDVEPFKVTLQVSHKGLKIIQNVVSQGGKGNKPKNETIKHFIPHNTITCVYQQEDVIAVILLLFNPVTKCPLHVHAYRCDSVETATLLKQQLQVLIERPENQKKFLEIEAKFKPQKEVKKVDSSLGSDTGTSTRESESSEERYAVDNVRVTTLYDSVAAELRAKLGKNNVPILLPPRDYDTVHRQKGNLTGIELRRCLNSNIVGQNVKPGRIESSGGSSGIGSDHPPSPESADGPDYRFNSMDNLSTSDEDWNGDTTDSTLYLMHTAPHVSLPRPLKSQDRDRSPDGARDDVRQESRFSRYSESDKYTKSPHRDEKFFGDDHDNITKYLEKPIAKFSDNKFIDRQRSLEREKQKGSEKHGRIFGGHIGVEKQISLERPSSYEKQRFMEKERLLNRQKSLDSDDRFYYRDRVDKYSDDDRYERAKHYSEDRKEKEKPVKYFEEDGFEDHIRNRKSDMDPRFYNSHRSETFEDSYNGPIPKSRQKYANSEQNSRYNRSPSVEKFSREEKIRQIEHDRYEDERRFEDRQRQRDGYFEEPTNRKLAQYRQRTPSPDPTSPKDRFKDAKEKFLSMEKERLKEEPITPVHKGQSYLKRHESMMHPRYDERCERYFEERPSSKSQEEVRYRKDKLDKFDPKRRSMFSLIEEEHRKNSNEIAKEIKRRSYMENNSYEEQIFRERERSYQELPESERYSGMDRDREHDNYNFSKSKVDIDKVNGRFVKNQVKSGAGYRHSYAEHPKQRNEKNGAKKHFSDMLHRANSSLSSNARVGIASVQPY